ncbi:hypothetical protein [Cytophaga aurantiaca]|uniref:hypothetical protein n=1 Tax=Cytophaga aurantiaca TaxID=29530 RepID=UPI000364A69D|nr:hypothetical protein [Cytophaga aurantiaca]
MIEGRAILWTLLTSMLIACTQHTESKQSAIPPAADTCILSVDSTADMYPYEEQIQYGENEYIPPAQTRLRFKNFNLIIHNFAGYDINGEGEERTYGGQFYEGVDKHGAHLNDDEIEQDGYEETLIVTADTVYLSESLANTHDNKIDKTLFEIVPNHSTDTYKISYCYLTAIYEMFEHVNVPDEEKEKLYANRFYRKEHTAFIAVPDSAKLFFKLITLKDNEQQAFYTNGSMSQEYYQKDLKRIRNQYGLKDTLIQYSGEGGSWYATLKKGTRIYGYDADSYLIRVERYADNKLAETKYIVIFIAYGC